MQLNPARGRKHLECEDDGEVLAGDGLCSSTPRGDGNLPEYRLLILLAYTDKVYAAQPREGTETLKSS